MRVISEIRLRYFEGCPNWRTAEARVREAVRSSGSSDAVSIVLDRVESDDDAQRLRFLGSPTVLFDGLDPFPTGQSTFGLACRVYQTEAGIEGSPSLAQLRTALLGSLSVGPDPESEPERCCFDDWAVGNAKRARRKEISAGVTRDLVEALGPSRLEGRTVLDLGCGTGDLALAALARGATRATGVDLGAGAIEEARALARERLVEDRSTFQVGDAAKVPLDRHDVVMLNRVLCCYPEVDALLDNSLSAASHVYAFTAPPSAGLAGTFARAETRLANTWFRIRDKKFRGFRVHVHDLEAVDRRIREAGFHRIVAGRRRLVWHLAIYERAA
jgi:SAM-dependent methyltransferase